MATAILCFPGMLFSSTRFFGEFLDFFPSLGSKPPRKSGKNLFTTGGFKKHGGGGPNKQKKIPQKITHFRKNSHFEDFFFTPFFWVKKSWISQSLGALLHLHPLIQALDWKHSLTKSSNISIIEMTQGCVAYSLENPRRRSAPSSTMSNSD